MKIHSFDPVVSIDAKVLILGSMPGAESLKKQEYYAYSRNAFWKIIHEILEETYREEYSDRLFMLKEHKIALWDVLQHCERKGSLDKDINNEYPNNFEAFYTNSPSIRAVFFNGQKAANSYEKYIGVNRSDISFFTVPSTSPANTVGYIAKLNAWSVIKPFLS